MESTLKDPWYGDEDPLLALRAGRPEPFETFVSRATPQLVAFFARLGAPATEAEDLVQELFLKLFQHAHTSYKAQGRFAPFVFRVARNAWIDRVRRVRARAEGPPQGMGPGTGPGAGEPADEAQAWAEAESHEPDPAVRVGRREEVATLRRAWSELPEHHRLVFELGVLQERSYAEISEALDVPVGTVKSRMFYALRKLREARGVDSGEAGA